MIIDESIRGIKLKILYYVRKDGEISFANLYKKTFEQMRRSSPSSVHDFPHILGEFVEHGYIKVYVKKQGFKQTQIKGKKQAKELFSDTLWKMVHPGIKESEDETDPVGVFFAGTEKLETLRMEIGFSVTREVQELWREERCNELFGPVRAAKDKVFVIMRFDEEMAPIFNGPIVRACKNLEVTCSRVDMVKKPEIIINNIWSWINNAEVIVCDCTGRNANVFYELGLAHALGKKVICITQNEDDIPFDIKHIRYIKYENTDLGLRELEETLTEYIKECLQQ